MMVLALVAISVPGWAQEEGEARLGGGSDVTTGMTVRLPQGGSIPAIHVIFADNPEDVPIRVEFRADTPTGFVVEPEWEEKMIPARGNVQNHFALEVGSSVAPGEYPVVIQLVRSDIESERGRITNIPAIQTAFTVEATGEAATVTVRSVSALTGEPVTATITLSARDTDRGWFEVDQTENTTLESRVSPGEYRAAVLLGEREMAAEEFTVEADQTLDVVLEVEAVSFVLATARPVEERGRVVVAELVASVNNETEPIPGPAVSQARVFHGDTEADTVTLENLSELPAGITESALTYRPEEGWQPGTYRFVFELVTPEFTLVASDQPLIDVPAVNRFDLLALLSALDTREAIALAAAALLAVVLVAQLVRVLVRRRRHRKHPETGPPPAQPGPSTQARSRRIRQRRRKGNHAQPSNPTGSWLEERIGPTTSQRFTWDESNDVHDTPDTPPPPTAEPSSHPGGTDEPRGSHLPTTRDGRNHELAPPIPSAGEAPFRVANGGDMASMVEALRVVQQLHDQGSLASDWSITDATLIYWAMISPRVHETLDSVGMSEEEYVTAMRRLFTHGLLGQDPSKE